jgi:hypothetical protein
MNTTTYRYYRNSGWRFSSALRATQRALPRTLR